MYTVELETIFVRNGKQTSVYRKTIKATCISDSLKKIASYYKTQSKAGYIAKTISIKYYII